MKVSFIQCKDFTCLSLEIEAVALSTICQVVLWCAAKYLEMN